MSITATAEAMGYQSIHAFSRAFHRETGLSPRDYKKWAEESRNGPSAGSEPSEIPNESEEKEQSP